jgi:hypothetical protein
MRTAALFFSSLGIVSALIMVAGPLWYIRGLPASQVVGPLILTALLIATHYLTLRRVRVPLSARPSRRVLLVANGVLFIFFVWGLLYFRDKGRNELFLIGYGVLYLSPLGVNSIYLLGFDPASSDVAAN